MVAGTQADESASVLETLRDAVRGTEYAGRLYLVGGFVRDQVMGVSSAADDVDIVLEGDALGLAQFLHERGVTDHKPVVYPRFGTAMVAVRGREIELVTARSESYADHSRKPSEVRPGTLADDARRRDFTINTLLQNLDSGEIVDPLGLAFADIERGVIRTPTEPAVTFRDDPLRMLRAVRFAARFGFAIDPETWEGMRSSAHRLAIISAERIRDEFSKTLQTDRTTLGLTLLKDSGLLALFLPELVAMVGVEQNAFHAYPVWEHVLAAVAALPRDSPLTLRLAVLFHDIGKPSTRSIDTEGHTHFYRHEDVGADMARRIMQRLKFANDEVDPVVRLVAEHMRIGEYQSSWSDSAVRRLIRDLGPSLDDLFALHRADVAALAPAHRDISHAHDLRERITEMLSRQDVLGLSSPLDGREIMQLLRLPAGRAVGEIKAYLTDEVVEGRLAPTDKEEAARLARLVYEGRRAGKV